MERLAWLALAGAWAKHQGQVTIRQDGQALDLHVSALLDRVTTDGDALTMAWSDEIRAFVTLRPMDDMPSDNYYNFTLFNKELSFRVDLSRVGCSCNAALFFTSMPGYYRNGTLAPGGFNPYYCDANDIGGIWCWEHDTIEANMYGLHTTPHKCTSPAGAYIEHCDQAGCSSGTDPKSMCPHESCIIDTREPFRMAQRFESDAEGEHLLKLSNRITQGDKSFDMDVCKSAYLREMSDALKGKMVMVFQLWGDSNKKMSWLDGSSKCTEDCNVDTTSVTFSDIQINSIKQPPVVVV